MVDIFSLGALGILGFLGAMLIPMIIIGIAVYIYAAMALMTIAKKTETENAWLAWIPIGNIYLMTQIGEISGWWTLIVLVAIIPILGGFAVMAGIVYFWWKIAERVGKPGWYGILMLVPIVNFVIMGMLAWGKD